MALNLNEEQRQRLRLLKKHIRAQGIRLRQDSDVCWDYILYGEEAKFMTDPAKIARKMAEAEYLHKYCDFQLGYDEAQKQAKIRAQCGQVPLDRQSWLEAVNKAVLKTTRIQTFPEVWPWNLGISPHEWQLKNNL